jgi:hypothetical protein
MATIEIENRHKKGWRPLVIALRAAEFGIRKTSRAGQERGRAERNTVAKQGERGGRDAPRPPKFGL